jgi:hypothetical protein
MRAKLPCPVVAINHDAGRPAANKVAVLSQLSLSQGVRVDVCIMSGASILKVAGGSSGS